MITNPNTCGLFEPDMIAISEAVHAAGAFVYCDGANFNAIVGKVRPGDLGIDAMHINLHKTFSTPHGGGGPGSGPVVLSEALAPYGPLPFVAKYPDGSYRLVEEEHGADEHPGAFGRMVAFHGQMGMFTRALAYILSHGADGLKQVAEDAVLNANYILRSLEDVLDAPFAGSGPCMHEAIFSDKGFAGGLSTIDLAKALIDEGFHPMTMYFPLVVHGAMLIEPTETESKASLDQFIAAVRSIAERAKAGDQSLKAAPIYAPRRRLDETLAARKPVLAYREPEPARGGRVREGEVECKSIRFIRTGSVTRSRSALSLIVLALRMRSMSKERPLKLATCGSIPLIYLLVAGSMLFSASPPLLAGAWSARPRDRPGRRMASRQDDPNPARSETGDSSQKASPLAMVLLVALIAFKLGARAIFGETAAAIRQAAHAAHRRLHRLRARTALARRALELYLRARAIAGGSAVTDERRFYEAPAAGARRSAPAALRNREPIAEVLARMAAGRAASCSKLPAGPASMRCISPSVSRRSSGSRATCIPMRWLRSKPGARQPGCRTSASRSRSMRPRRTGRSTAPTPCSASTWSISARGPRRSD